MRRIAALSVLVLLTLAACAPSEPPTQPTPSVTETEPQEPETAVLSEEDLLAAAKARTELTDETHLYDDFDFDGRAELLLVTKNAEGLYETWFCPSDGGECVCIRTAEHEWDAVSMSSVVQNDGQHVIVSYRLAMGTAAHTDILRIEEGLMTVAAESVHTIWCEDGNVVLMREDYDMMYDPSLEFTIGHTYKVTILTYDDGAYFEYAAKEVPLDEVKAMKGSDTLFGQIEADENVPNKAYLRANGYGYVQCGDLDADREAGVTGYYCYYTFRYDADTVTALVPGTFGTFDNAGLMMEHFGDFPVRES